MPGLFISYRRSDSEAYAGRLYDRLVAEFGKDQVFKDVDSIPVGADFRAHLQAVIGECRALLAIVGTHWIDARDERNVRRLENGDDFVRIELEMALARGIPVIPVLVSGATMPSEAQLPASLAALAYRQATQVRPDPDFHRDVDRLLASLPSPAEASTLDSSAPLDAPSGPPAARRSGSRRPGREKERAELWKAYREASRGHGLLSCLAGEPGIGKTTVAEEFLDELAHGPGGCFVARGRCSERLAGSEAYLPLLEALESLLRGPNQAAAARAMKALAPAWFAQVASAEKQPQTQSVSQEQLKRQLAALFRELSRVSPVVLFLDDLHWADASTIDLLAYLATKFGELRLLVITSYRPSDLLLAKHPFASLKLELEGRGDCREMRIGFLTPEDVGAYLASEFPARNFPPSLAQLLHARTEGNPLFLVNLVSDLRDRQLIAQQDGAWILRATLEGRELELPASIRSVIERKRERLSTDEQQLLAAASVQGFDFDSAVVAEILGLDVADVEDRLAVLERVHRFVGGAGETEFPDGAVSSHYRFVHVLYQNAFYDALPPARRRTLSLKVARALEQHSASEAARIAAELAMLYEVAREFRQSSHYFLLAATSAARLSAHQEAAKLARRGLEQLKSLPEDAECTKRELALQNALAYSLFLIKGYCDPEVEQTFRRARDLAHRTGQSAQLLGILRGLCFYHGTRGQFSPWRSLSGEILELAEQSGDPGLKIISYHLAGDLYLWLGDFAQSREFFLKGINLYRADRDRSLPERFGAYDLAVGCRMFLAHDLWYLGYPDQARDAAEEALRWARELKHAYSVAASSGHCAWIYILRGEPRLARERAQECFQVSDEHGFPFHIAHARAFRGWAIADEGSVEEGIADLEAGIAIYRASGAITELPFMAVLLAQALAKTGRFDAALTLIDGALEGFERVPLYCDAELARCRGELLVAKGADSGEAETCYRTALEAARRQRAKSLELRAVLGLSHVLNLHGQKEEATRLLADIYSSFTEGFESSDLRQARAALKSQP
jgi:tetratricopeptide (TPR) repeat protein